MIGQVRVPALAGTDDVIHEKVCTGLTAGWLNGWLAAVGATVISPRIRLSWTDDAMPLAVLSSKNINPVEALIASWPDQQRLDEMPIASEWRSCSSMKRQVPDEVFTERVRAARSHLDAWTLSSTMTDLQIDKKGQVAHAPLDPAGPGTIKWLHHRLCKCYAAIDDLTAMLAATLNGNARRISNNGLGFDITRVANLADKTERWVDPVVEVLAFFGLALLPVRGAGLDQRIKRVNTGSSVAFIRSSVRQRCWHSHRSESGRTIRTMCWPAWSQPLTQSGIDALLDQWNPLLYQHKASQSTNPQQSTQPTNSPPTRPLSGSASRQQSASSQQPTNRSQSASSQQPTSPRNAIRDIRKSQWQSIGVHAGWMSVEYQSRGAGDRTRALGSVPIAMYPTSRDVSNLQR